MQKGSINVSAPNLMNICIDEKADGKISGRLYHCYQQEPVFFCDVVELIREAEKLFDGIGFPQASTMTRSFAEAKGMVGEKEKLQKVRSQQEIIGYTGEKGTFITNIRFRQSSTWQGDVCCMETGEVRCFSNTLDFIKVLDAEC